MVTLAALVFAAIAEIAGDAAIRQGLTRSSWPWFGFGAAALVVYGFAVNLDRAIRFGQLMGLYIVVFFLVSQLSSFVFFDERPPASLVLGGALIVVGGLVIHLGSR
jgi:drug/metabolite transporter superfamily protein YnfA